MQSIDLRSRTKRKPETVGKAIVAQIAEGHIAAEARQTPAPFGATKHFMPLTPFLIWKTA
jgi:hypothetical protein